MILHIKSKIPNIPIWKFLGKSYDNCGLGLSCSPFPFAHLSPSPSCVFWFCVPYGQRKGCSTFLTPKIFQQPSESKSQMEHAAADVVRGGILPHKVQGSQGVRAPSLAVGKAAWVSLGKCFRSSTSKAGRKSPADPALCKAARPTQNKSKKGHHETLFIVHFFHYF